MKRIIIVICCIVMLICSIPKPVFAAPAVISVSGLVAGLLSYCGLDINVTAATAGNLSDSLDDLLLEYASYVGSTVDALFPVGGVIRHGISGLLYSSGFVQSISNFIQWLAGDNQTVDVQIYQQVDSIIDGVTFYRPPGSWSIGRYDYYLTDYTDRYYCYGIMNEAGVADADKTINLFVLGPDPNQEHNVGCEYLRKLQTESQWQSRTFTRFYGQVTGGAYYIVGKLLAGYHGLDNLPSGAYPYYYDNIDMSTVAQTLAGKLLGSDEQWGSIDMVGVPELPVPEDTDIYIDGVVEEDTVADVSTYVLDQVVTGQLIIGTEDVVTPTVVPTVAPTVQPTVAPTVQPTVAPTVQPTAIPSYDAVPDVLDVPQIDTLIREKLPFCVVYDIEEILESFISVTPRAPRITYEFGFRNKNGNYDTAILTIDLSSWDSVAQYMRYLIYVLFVLMFMRRIFGWGEAL